MAIYMKTTVDIADALFERVKALASKEKTSLRALIEEGLAQVLERRAAQKGFTLRDASFKGEGLHPGVAEGGWELIRDQIYEGRGS